MKDELLKIEHKFDQNKTNILNEAIINLENIFNNINIQDKENINNKINIIISNIKNFISEYQNNTKEIKLYIENLIKDNYDMKKKLAELTNNNNIQEKVFQSKTKPDIKGKYIGQLKEGIREGRGTIYWENGDKYEGEWKNDKNHGKGIYYYNAGDRY